MQGQHATLRLQGVREKPGQTLQVQKQLNISMAFEKWKKLRNCGQLQVKNRSLMVFTHLLLSGSS